MKIEEKAYAKLNISLDIVSRFPDGYHEMSMIMQSVELHDYVTVCNNGTGGITVRTNLRYVPSDSRNIAYKAAKAFFEEAGINNGTAEIVIEKTIPVCSGMGGGSSDGAAVLRALNTIYDTGYSAETLRHIADGVGSDVSFCVTGGTYLATGRGQVLSRLPSMPTCHIVIVKPTFSVSTPELFAKVDCRRIKLRPDTKGIEKSLAQKDIKGVSRRMYNVFEDVLGDERSTIDDIRESMLDCGALGAVMTGTGSAVFGIFAERYGAETAAGILSNEYTDVFLTRPQPELQM